MLQGLLQAASVLDRGILLCLSLLASAKQSWSFAALPKRAKVLEEVPLLHHML